MFTSVSASHLEKPQIYSELSSQRACVITLYSANVLTGVHDLNHKRFFILTCESRLKYANYFSFSLCMFIS